MRPNNYILHVIIICLFNSFLYDLRKLNCIEKKFKKFLSVLSYKNNVDSNERIYLL